VLEFAAVLLPPEVHSVYLGSRGSNLYLFQELGQGVSRALRYGLHGVVGEVTNVPGETQEKGLPAREISEEDPLHSSEHYGRQTRKRGHSFPLSEQPDEALLSLVQAVEASFKSKIYRFLKFFRTG